MSNQYQDEVAVVGELIKSAGLSADAERMLQWCIEPIPALCRQFAETYESRLAEEVIRREQNMLTRLAQEGKAEPAIQQTADAVRERLQGLNERIGIPWVDPKPAPMTRPRRRKSA
jgi:hypothetical protein